MSKECFACGSPDVQIVQDAEGTIHNICEICGFHFRNDYLASSSAVERVTVNHLAGGSIPS